jgi:hypothetical protein
MKNECFREKYILALFGNVVQSIFQIVFLLKILNWCFLSIFDNFDILIQETLKYYHFNIFLIKLFFTKHTTLHILPKLNLVLPKLNLVSSTS